MRRLCRRLLHGGSALWERRNSRKDPTFSQRRMHSSSLKTKQTLLSPFLLSESLFEVESYAKNGTKKPHHLMQIASNDANSRIDTKGRFHALRRMSATKDRQSDRRVTCQNSLIPAFLHKRMVDLVCSLVALPLETIQI